mgnify:CR=1 FL=1
MDPFYPRKIELKKCLHFNSISELIIFIKSKNYFLDKNIVLFSDNVVLDFHQFKSNFYFILAAGGLVRNIDNHYLMILKNNIWDLPKGKVDYAESVADAAIREVGEETNVKSLQIISKAFSTFHIYIDSHIDPCHIVLKETKWFIMESTSDVVLIGQKKEGISKVAWMSNCLIDELNTYKSIKYLFKEFVYSSLSIALVVYF